MTLFNVFSGCFSPSNQSSHADSQVKRCNPRAVLKYTRHGWPSTVPEHLQPYWIKRNELTVEKGIRITVPNKLRDLVLQEIHQGHPGMTKMKQIARSHVWWPKLDADIETLSKACKACQEVRNSPSSVPFHGPQNLG